MKYVWINNPFSDLLLNYFWYSFVLSFWKNILLNWIEGMDGFSPYFHPIWYYVIIFIWTTQSFNGNIFLESILAFFTLVHKAYVVLPLPFWHLLDTYIYFGNRNKNILKFLELRWGKKCQVVLHYLSTSHHQGLGQELNRNVKQISRINFSHYE